MLESINKHTKANIDYFKLGINLFELSQKGSELYLSKAVAEEKRELLNFVFLNFKFNGEKLNPTPHNGFEVIASCAKTHNVVAPHGLEPRFPRSERGSLPLADGAKFTTLSCILSYLSALLYRSQFSKTAQLSLRHAYL